MLLKHELVLEAVNGKAVELQEGMTAPSMQFDENLMANGFNGCNRFFGQGELNGTDFVIKNMGSTKMACQTQEADLETAMNSVLSTSSKISLADMKDNAVEFKNDKYSLKFALRSVAN